MEEKTIFTKIIQKEIPAFILSEDKDHIAFLDINPTVIGHTLVVPKKVIDYFFDIPDKELATFISFSKRIAKGLQKIIPCLRIGMKVHGLEVPHAHIHLIPILDHTADKTKHLQSMSMEALTKAIAGVLTQESTS